MSIDSVHWRFTTANSRTLRALSYLAIGLTLGPCLGVVAMAGGVFASASHSPETLFLVLVLALIAGLGVGSGRALFALGNAPPEVHETVRALSRRWVLGSILAGAGLALGGLYWTDVGLEILAGCVGVGLSALVVGAGLQSVGAVDGAEETVEYGNHTISVGAMRTVRAVRGGAFVVAVVQYVPGRVGPSVPRFVVLSADALDALESIRAALEARGDVERGDSEERHTTPTAVRLVAGGFGVACIAAGPVLWFALPQGAGRLLAGYLGLFGLLFGALFLRYAVVS